MNTISRVRLAVGFAVLLAAIPAGAATRQAPPPVAERTLVVGLVVDRDGARLVGFTARDRPFPHGAWGHEGEIEVALRGADDRRFARRIPANALCLEHEPDDPPHVEGDTFVLHRDGFLVELPDLDGFDRIEVSDARSKSARLLAVLTLDATLYRRSGGGVPLGKLRISTATGPTLKSTAAAGVIWPEDLDDPDLLRVWGDEEEGDRRLNIVIVPDGYTYADKAKMVQHAGDLVAHLRQTLPYQAHDALVNYTLVYSYSVESGNDQCDCGTVVNNAMGTFFPATASCGSASNRCIAYGAGCDTNGTTNIVAAELRAPVVDRTLVMVNTTRYGGCAGSRAVYSAGHAQGAEVAAHELGHSIAGLADEYVSQTGCGQGGSSPNTSNDSAVGNWPEWIADLGAPSEGARYWSQCIYRPQSSCKMRSLGPPFCPVCNQRFSLVFFGHHRVAPTAPIAEATAAPAEILLGGSVQFEVTTRFALPPATNAITWTVQGPGDPAPAIVARDVEAHLQQFHRLGTWTVTAEVVAATNLIKPQRFGANRDVVTWQVEAVASICEVGCADGLPECDLDGDGLGDRCDPCPDEPLNGCFGPAAVDRASGIPLRVNAGDPAGGCGGTLTDCRGATWESDFGSPAHPTGYNQSAATVICDVPAGCPVDSAALFGCTDGPTADLLRCQHAMPDDGPDLAYAFDLPDGDYVVNLLLLNPASATADAGNVRFSVAANGSTPVQWTGLDPVAAAGGACDPYAGPCLPVGRSAQVALTGGAGLRLDFLPEVGRPSVAGIEVLCRAFDWYADMDGDGFGDPEARVAACVSPPDHVPDATDCDDGNSAVFPGVAEMCNGYDDDCNGVADEDGDADGHPACDDCRDDMGSVWALPGEAVGLVVDADGTWHWSEPADTGTSRDITYDVMRSTGSPLFTGGECSNVGVVASFNDPDTPPPDTVTHYLVRARHACGPGPLGHDSSGAERTPASCPGNW